MNKNLIALLSVAGAAIGAAQTPPIQPDTPPVVVPPPVRVPTVTPDEAHLGEPITADEAVAIALRRQPQVSIAQADVRAAQGRVQQARSDLGPQFSLSAGASEQRQFRGAGAGQSGGDGIQFQSGVNVQQLLFDFGRTLQEVRQQSEFERAAREALSGTNQDVAFAVRRAFYDFRQAIRQLEVSEANVQNRQRQLDLAEARLNSGLGAPGDVVRARSGMADAVLALTNARNLETVSRSNLATLMGVDARTPIRAAESSEEAPPLELDSLVQNGLTTRPEVREAQARVRAAGLGVSIADKTNVPSIGLSAGVNARGDSDPLASQSGTVGINLTWRFIDSGFTAGRRREARAFEDQARSRLTLVSQQVTSEITEAFSDLLSAEQRIATAEAQVANALELVRISEGRFAGGIGTFLEVSDAQATLFGAERNLVQAQNDVQRFRAALRRAAGISVLP